MAQYRLIYQGAGTGERITALSHLEFRVWVQYQLSADDYGVCPAEAVKLQGDNVALQDESQRRIQTAIERLIAVQLCGVFQDGRRRYLYQPDWQDRQKIRHFTATSHPAIPAEELRKCSAKTQAIFRERFRNSSEEFPLHARACDAHANANADQRSEPDVPPTGSRRGPRAHAAGALAGTLPRDHVDHGWCGARFCVKASQINELVRRYGAGGETAVPAWLTTLEAGLGPEDSPGGPVWVLQHFDAWLTREGRLKAAPRPAPAAVVSSSSVPDAAETRRYLEDARRRAGQ